MSDTYKLQKLCFALKKIGQEQEAAEIEELIQGEKDVLSEEEDSSLKTEKSEENVGEHTIITNTISVDGGSVVVWENSPYANNAHSIYSFVVSEDRRGQGIGSKLIDAVINAYPQQEISAQVSSIASLKVFYNKGFTNFEKPNGSFEELVSLFKEYGGSLNMRFSGQSSSKSGRLSQLLTILLKIGSDEEAEDLRKLIEEADEDPFLQESQEPSEELEGQRDIESSGIMPNFDWLLKGNLFKDIKYRNPLAYEEFLDENSNALLNFESPKYLGSGAMADAWLTEGRVLKIFNANAFAYNQEPSYSQYQNMYLSQWSQWSEDNESIKNPMIYGIGRFSTPFSISKMRLNPNYSRGQPNLAWVLMEKVTTIDELTNKYISDSGTDIERDIISEDQERDPEGFEDWEDWDLTESNPNFKMEELYEVYEDLPYLLESVSNIGDNINHIESEELIRNLVSVTINGVISESLEKASEYYNEKYEYASDREDYENESEWLDYRYNLDDEEESRIFFEHLVSEEVDRDDNSGTHNGRSVALVERILGLNQKADLENGIISPTVSDNDWLVDIVIEAFRKLIGGYGDVHSGNFRFRKEVDKEGNYRNRPVYFDAANDGVLSD